MKQNSLRTRQVLLGIVLVLQLRGTGHGFDDNAHGAISRRAVSPNVSNASQLDNFLKTYLPYEFSQGVNEPLAAGQTALLAIAEGAVKEDYPLQRTANHFHDPTRTWNIAGLSVPLIGPVGNSSVVWSQLPVQGAGSDRSWKNARDAYFNALTSTSASARKAWFAETFRTLGHLIHHVQDAAVPSHTRNDTHISLGKFGDRDPFHTWAEKNIAKINNVTSAIRFDSSILNQQSTNPLAPAPVARIIDKTDGDLGILSPNVNVGIAEYSNANFISKSTARSTRYQYPLYSQLLFGVETLSNGKRVRYARFRPGFGEQDYRVGVSSRMVRFVNAAVPPDSIDFGLDDNVHDDYARKLFPRAIGYSAGLIDYFFRNAMSGSALDFGCSLTPPFPTEYPNDTFSLFVSTGAVDPQAQWEPVGPGRVVIVVHYKNQGQHFYFTLFDGTGSFDPVQWTNWNNLSSAPVAQIPAGATEIYFTIAYRGPLGQEPDAVIGGVGHFSGLC